MPCEAHIFQRHRRGYPMHLCHSQYSALFYFGLEGWRPTMFELLGLWCETGGARPQAMTGRREGAARAPHGFAALPAVPVFYHAVDFDVSKVWGSQYDPPKHEDLTWTALIHGKSCLDLAAGHPCGSMQARICASTCAHKHIMMALQMQCATSSCDQQNLSLKPQLSWRYMCAKPQSRKPLALAASVLFVFLEGRSGLQV